MNNQDEPKDFVTKHEKLPLISDINLLMDSLPGYEDDLLGYNPLAEDLSKRILGFPSPLVVAICAPWGSGKTTFIKFLMKHISSSDDNIVIVYFNAWHASTNENALSAFVHSLTDELMNAGVIDKHPCLKKQLKESGKLLFNATVDAFSETTITLRLLSSIFKRAMAAKYDQAKRSASAENKMREQFLKICKSLNEQEIKPIVFIDELDRCRPDAIVNIIESLRMIFSGNDELFELAKEINKEAKDQKTGENTGIICGNTESFLKNTSSQVPFKYILAIDESYLAKAFEKAHGFSNDRSHEYISKFVQYRYNFPAKDYSKFISSILDQLNLPDTIMPPKTSNDMANILSGYGYLPARDIKKIMAHLIVWQFSYYDELVQYCSELAERFESEEVSVMAMRLANSALFVWAIIKIKYPIMTDQFIREGIIPLMILEQPSELERRLADISNSFADKTIYNNMKKSINLGISHIGQLREETNKLIHRIKEKQQGNSNQMAANMAKNVIVDIGKQVRKVMLH